MPVNDRCFYADKFATIRFLHDSLKRPDAAKYFNSFRDGSLKHWQDLFYALLVDQTDNALLTFAEAAFIGREMGLTANAMIPEIVNTVAESPEEKRRPGIPKRLA